MTRKDSELRQRLIDGMHAEYERQFGKPMFPPYAEAAVDAVLDQLSEAGLKIVRIEEGRL